MIASEPIYYRGMVIRFYRGLWWVYSREDSKNPSSDSFETVEDALIFIDERTHKL